MLAYDDEIVALRRNVREAAEAKVQNGILNVTDLMQEVDAENLAKLDRITHDIQLLMAVYMYKNTTGNK